MDFFETVRSRRSIRRFSDKPVADSDLLVMLEAAVLAPSASNQQPWYFIIIRDKELKQGMHDVVNAMLESSISATGDLQQRKRLLKLRPYSLHFVTAPVAIAVLARPWSGEVPASPEDPTPRDLAVESVSMAIAHLLLAATDLGYSSCFASAPAVFARKEIEALLHIEQPWFLIGIVSLGIAARLPHKRSSRKSLQEVCTFIG